MPFELVAISLKTICHSVWTSGVTSCSSLYPGKSMRCFDLNKIMVYLFLLKMCQHIQQISALIVYYCKRSMNCARLLHNLHSEVRPIKVSDLVLCRIMHEPNYYNHFNCSRFSVKRCVSFGRMHIYSSRICILACGIYYVRRLEDKTLSYIPVHI